MEHNKHVSSCVSYVCYTHVDIVFSVAYKQMQLEFGRGSFKATSSAFVSLNGQF